MNKPEDYDQINTINWFKYEFPELAEDIHHFANERFLDVQKNPKLWATAKKLTKMGVTAGVLDILLAIPLNGKAGLWIELKHGKNKPTKEQIAFAERKIMRGYECAFVWGFEAAKEIILTYLKPLISDSTYNTPNTLYKIGPIC